MAAHHPLSIRMLALADAGHPRAADLQEAARALDEAAAAVRIGTDHDHAYRRAHITALDLYRECTGASLN